MKSDAQRQSEYLARQAGKGRSRLNCWIEASTKKTINELAKHHGKTIADVIDLGVAAAKAMLGKRSTAAPCVIIQQRAVAPSRHTADTNAPIAQETTPTLYEPEQATDDVDDRIRRAAASMGS